VKNLSFEWLVGLRYTRAGRRSSRGSFISFISLISMAGIGLGVAALIIVLSVMNGFQKEVRDRMLSVLPHIEVFDASGVTPDWRSTSNELQKYPAVLGTAPYVDAQAMMVNDGVMRGSIVRGILPEEEPKVSVVASKVKLGKLSDLREGSFNIILGIDLARALHVGIGEKVTLGTADGQLTPAGTLPRLKAFTVVAVFDVGHYELDSGMAFIHLGDAQKFFRQDAPTGVRIRIKDMMQAPQIAFDLSRNLGGSLIARDWTQQNRNYFAAVKTEKTMMFIILAMIILVASFNLISSLVVTVSEKQADIAILRTLGASPKSIMKIFLIQGGMVAFMGTTLGVLSGVVVALNIDVIVPFIERLLGMQFLPKEVYVISSLPSDLHWDDVITVGSIAVVMAFLSTIYPSWRAARVKPAEALRYE
jgi:lipoprotein-releasing system permease protein